MREAEVGSTVAMVAPVKLRISVCQARWRLSSLVACYLRTLGVVVMLSTKPAWATYVCLQEDAEEAAEERWGWEVVQGETVYDPDRYGYWVTMEDHNEQIQVKFIAIDC